MMDPKGISSKIMMKRAYFMTGLCCLMAFIFSGCFENYGRLHWDPQVTATFENHDIQPGFNYYYYGVGNQTYAVAGISTELSLKSTIWREIPQDTGEFKILISRAWENYAYKPYDPQGAHILNPEGNRVGLWYSSLRFVAIKFDENNRIQLMPETPFLGGPEADSTRPDSSQRLSA
ncbi:MAG: hypothetical protein KJP23_18435, partial [Deltaproteobacteria bacterium]|nr:hypothetical protein [Deltaproteobacteria bacterium]